MQIDGRLSALREISQLRLINILNQIPGKKDLIIDGSLMKALDRITGISVLRYQYHVTYCLMFCSFEPLTQPNMIGVCYDGICVLQETRC